MPKASPSWLLWPLLIVGVFIVPTYFLLKQTNPDSWLVFAAELAIGAVSALWGAALIIALSFERREQFLERVKALYRRALTMRWMLVISLITLTSAQGLLLSELVGTRSLDIPTEGAVDVLLNDEPGQVFVLGSLKAGACDDVDPPNVRAPVGEHILVFRSRASGEAIASHEVKVLPFWKDQAPLPCIPGEHDVSTLN